MSATSNIDGLPIHVQSALHEILWSLSKKAYDASVKHMSSSQGHPAFEELQKQERDAWIVSTSIIYNSIHNELINKLRAMKTESE